MLQRVSLPTVVGLGCGSCSPTAHRPTHSIGATSAGTDVAGCQRSMIEIAGPDGVAVLTMRHGRANALDVELCRALGEALDSAVADGAQALVLTGAETIFSAGVDLHRVIAADESYLADFLFELRRAFMRLARVELPVVAAVNGHAIAGGCILVAAADWAVMANGAGRIGVTELLVGVPFPAVALELLRRRAGEDQARRLVLAGETLEAEPALARGLVDEVVPPELVMERSLAAARRLAAVGPAFAVTKRQLRVDLEARISRLALLDGEVDAVWRDPGTIQRMRSYMSALRNRSQSGR
jgi:enoyl-CoA hydratase